MKNFDLGKGMVDVSDKNVTKRIAIASARIGFNQKAFKILITDGSPKGNIWETAKLAGIMAAKNTPQLIPLCHPLAISKANVTFQVDKKKKCVFISSEVVCLGRTGVEMEALAAVSAAALTIYDMMKWTGQKMVITDLQLDLKKGGQSGLYKRN